MKTLMEKSVLELQLEKIIKEASKLDLTTLLFERENTEIPLTSENMHAQLQPVLQQNMHSPDTYFQLFRPKFTHMFNRHERMSF